MRLEHDRIAQCLHAKIWPDKILLLLTRRPTKKSSTSAIKVAKFTALTTPLLDTSLCASPASPLELVCLIP